MDFKTFCVVLFAVFLINVAVQAKDHKSPEKEKHGKKDDVKKEHKKRTVCERERVQCGAGRECIEDENGEPTCECIRVCARRSSPVCATNGKSYDNHCELHREACIQGIKLHVEHEGHCKAPAPSTTPQTKPVVCYQNDRDKLRQKMIDWMIAKEIPTGWFEDGKSYNEVIKTFFDKYDQTGDGKLDSNEMLKLVEGNDTVKNVVVEGKEEEILEKESENAILRGLCVDALIDIGDEDADWVLDLAEFENCMDPEFKPPHRRCSLEDEYFEDGAETKVKCNSCVCACGNWVCTAMTCDENDKPLTDKPEQDKEEEEYDPAMDFPEEMTEEEFQAYLQKLTETDSFDDVFAAEKDVEEEEKEVEMDPIMPEKVDPFENIKDKKHDKRKEGTKDEKYMSSEKF